MHTKVELSKALFLLETQEWAERATKEISIDFEES